MTMECDQQPLHTETIIGVLRKRRLYTKYVNYLPSPEYVQKIIIATNLGHIEEASIRITKSEDLLKEIIDDLSSQDKEWYIDVLERLRSAVDSWKSR